MRLVFGLLLALTATLSASAAEISLNVAEGVAIKAEETGKGDHGVVLVHGQNRSRADWSYLAEKLTSQGYHVIAVDLRGHGATGGELPQPPEDLNPLIADVEAAIAYFEKAGKKQISVLGADLGANLAANAASKHPSVTSLVLLSPGINIKGVKAGPAIEAYGARPVLIVASSEVAYDLKSAAYLEGKATGSKHTELLDGAGTGTKMLSRDPNLEGLVYSWLNGTWAMQNGPASASQKALTGAAVDTKVETTGTRYGEKKPE